MKNYISNCNKSIKLKGGMLAKKYNSKTLKTNSKKYIEVDTTESVKDSKVFDNSMNRSLNSFKNESKFYMMNDNISSTNFRNHSFCSTQNESK